MRGIATAAGDIGAAIWIASVAWLPVLVIAEVGSRRLGYHLQRWSTLFPVGMYAAAGFEAARASGLHAAGSFARVWVWGGVALSLIVAAGLLRRALPARSAPAQNRPS